MFVNMLKKIRENPNIAKIIFSDFLLFIFSIYLLSRSSPSSNIYYMQLIDEKCKDSWHSLHTLHSPTLYVLQGSGMNRNVTPTLLFVKRSSQFINAKLAVEQFELYNIYIQEMARLTVSYILVRVM